MSNRLKYGIRASRITFLQDKALMHVRYNGRPEVFAFSLRYNLWTDKPAKDIAYAAIQAAAVCKPGIVAAAMRLAALDQLTEDNRRPSRW